jgi:hypothetical protein
VAKQQSLTNSQRQQDAAAATSDQAPDNAKLQAKLLRKPKPLTREQLQPRGRQVDPQEYEFDDQDDTASTQVVDEVPPSGPAAQPAAAVTPPPAPQPKHSRTMYRRAAEVGIEQAELDEMDAEEAFNEVLHRQTQLAAWQANERQASGRNASGASRQGLFNDQFAPEPEPEPQLAGQADDDLDLDELTDPKVAAALRRLSKENRDLQRRLEETASREEARERSTRNERIDRTFAGLSDYADIFGQGRLGELAPEELACRQAVLAIAHADQSHRAFEQKIERAVKTLYRHRQQPAAAPVSTPPAPPQQSYAAPVASQPATPAAQRQPANGDAWEEEELADRRRRWRDQVPVAQPSTSQPAPKKPGVQSAKEAFEAGLREHGLDGRKVSVEETAELPD